VRDLQRRLAAAGFLAPGAAEDSTFCARTHSAVIAFQDAFGLSATGVVDDVMWSTLIEASWSIGDRILYERTPNLRGDDVAELQSVLNRLGFDCGRVDGVFGPMTHSALIDFQRNMGLNANGIAAPDVVAMLLRVSSQSGDGPGVALVREREELTDSTSPLTCARGSRRFRRCHRCSPGDTAPCTRCIPLQHDRGVRRAHAGARGERIRS